MALAIASVFSAGKERTRAASSVWRHGSRASIPCKPPDPDSFLDSLHTHTKKFRYQSLLGDAIVLEKKNVDIEHDRQRRQHDKRKHVLSRFKIGLSKKPPAILQIARKASRPYVRFRRAARNVCKIIQVCLVCKQLVEDKIKREPWYNLIDNLMAETTMQKTRKGPRPFVTFVPNDKRELIQLTFDLSYFERSRKSESFLTEEVRNILQLLPGARTREQIAIIIRCMKGVSPEFNTYPLNVQKHMSQLAMYCRFAHNRVIIRKGFSPDGCYIVMSGILVEKTETKKKVREILPGNKFGEEDLICGCNRRTTVLTRTNVELFCIHKQDYRQIFNMAEDVSNPKNLDVCKQDVVFQHFPMHRLVENPGIWTIVKYKYGRLIAKDSNDLEWVYVVKSGEARLLKYLEPSYIDIKTRRQKIKAAMEQESPFFKKKQILQFIAERDYIKSAYRPSTYHPGRREGSQSAPPRYGHRSDGQHTTFLSLPCTPANKMLSASGRRKSILKTIEQTDKDDWKTADSARLPKIKIVDDEKEEDDDVFDKKDGDESENKEDEEDEVKEVNQDSSRVEYDVSTKPNQTQDLRKTCRVRSDNYVKTPSSRRKAKKPISVYGKMLPAFIQVETLHTGQVFGLRACLDAEERGPTVSLVSGDCELLQINKKFFMKHCDDAIYSLIRLKSKPFPSQEELLDRLDANMQWQEFKQQTLETFLKQCKRLQR